jgi:hypothetical protein
MQAFPPEWGIVCAAVGTVGKGLHSVAPHLIALNAVFRPITGDVGAAVAGHDLSGQQVTFIECSPHVQAAPILIQPTDESSLGHFPVVARFPVVICNTQHSYFARTCQPRHGHWGAYVNR